VADEQRTRTEDLKVYEAHEKVSFVGSAERIVRRLRVGIVAMAIGGAYPVGGIESGSYAPTYA
jgi:hypothetical protein